MPMLNFRGFNYNLSNIDHYILAAALKEFDESTDADHEVEINNLRTKLNTLVVNSSTTGSKSEFKKSMRSILGMLHTDKINLFSPARPAYNNVMQNDLTIHRKIQGIMARDNTQDAPKIISCIITQVLNNISAEAADANRDVLARNFASLREIFVEFAKIETADQRAQQQAAEAERLRQAQAARDAAAERLRQAQAAQAAEAERLRQAQAARDAAAERLRQAQEAQAAEAERMRRQQAAEAERARQAQAARDAEAERLRRQQAADAERVRQEQDRAAAAAAKAEADRQAAIALQATVQARVKSAQYY